MAKVTLKKLRCQDLTDDFFMLHGIGTDSAKLCVEMLSQWSVKFEGELGIILSVYIT